MPDKSPSTKNFVEIVDIRGTVAILKNGSLRSVIQVDAVNFDLKSTDEQAGLINGFQNFINAVDFPLQIVINSRKLNIEPYLSSLDAVKDKVSNELLKIQLYEYIRFIRGLTDLANIVAKKFYIVVPFYIVETAGGSASGLLNSLKSIFSPKKFAQSINEQQLDQYRIQLDERIALVIGAVGGLGLQARPLEADELRSMYYNYYNPGEILSKPELPIQ